MWNPLSLLREALGGFFFWLLVVAFLLRLLYRLGTRNFDYFAKRGVPYVRGARPFLGNMMDLISNGFMGDLTKIKVYGRVFGEMAGKTPVWVISDPVLINQIGIKEFSHFVNRRSARLPLNREFSKAMTMVTDAEWKGIRNVMTPTFSSAKMKKIIPLVQSCADEFCEYLQRNQDKELELKSIEVNSSREGNDNDMVKYGRRLFDSVSFKNPVLWMSMIFPPMVKVFELMGKGFLDATSMHFFSDYITCLMQQRSLMEENRPTDFLELLMNAQNEELPDEKKKDRAISLLDETDENIAAVKDWRIGKKNLSKLEILSNAMLFFLAGFETTSLTMCWIFHELAFNPDMQQRLYDEVEKTIEKYGSLTYEAVAAMSYMDQVFCETTRLYPAAQRTDRVCGSDCTIGDYKIEKGAVVNLAIYGVHRDPEFWPEPEVFRPERFAPENKDSIVPYSYLAFGIGPRNCVGQRLAILKTKIGVATVMRRFRFVPSESSERHPAFKKLGSCAPLKGIFLRLESR